MVVPALMAKVSVEKNATMSIPIFNDSVNGDYKTFWLGLAEIPSRKVKKLVTLAKNWYSRGSYG